MVLRINSSQVLVGLMISRIISVLPFALNCSFTVFLLAILLVLSICKSSPVNDRRASRNEVGESQRATIIPKQVRRRPDYNDLVELKNVDLTYGTKLSSLEEPQALKPIFRNPDDNDKVDIAEGDGEESENRDDTETEKGPDEANEEVSPIPVDGDATKSKVDPSKSNKRKSTRCSTDRSINLGPDFQLSSSAEINDDGNADDGVTKGVKKQYFGPPKAKTPDHYIDDA